MMLFNITRIQRTIALRLFLMAMISSLGISSAWAGVVTCTETWATATAGWVDRDAVEMVVSHTAEAGRPAGALVGVFALQSGVPVPETDAFRATTNSSGGGFTGNYWEHQSSFHGWSFDFQAGEVTPSTLQVRFGGGGSVFFANVLPQVGPAGSWRTIQTPTTHAGGWFGGTAAQWTNALSNVEWVEVQVARNGAEEQRYYLDNFGNNLPVIRESAVGDRVWFDVDSDGIQDAGETYAIQNMPVALMDATSNSVVASTTTDTNGYYLLSGLAAGQYVLRFDCSVEPGLMPSPVHQGGNAALDSDGTTNAASAGYAWTEVFSLGMTQTNRTLDLGMAARDGTRAELARVWGEWTGTDGVVGWQVGSEWGTAGYHVYRVDPQTGVQGRLNERLVAAAQTGGAAVYELRDPQAAFGAGGSYRLEEVEWSGKVRDLGIHEVSFAAASEVAAAAKAKVRPAGARVARQASVEPATGTGAVTVRVPEDGIYGVGLAELAAGLGRTLEEVQAAAAAGMLRIRSRGETVPAIYDAGRGRLVFYGRGPSADEWVAAAGYRIEKGAGLSMARRAPAAAGGQTACPVQVHFEQELGLGNTALPVLPDGGYYWSSIVSSTNALGGRRSFALDLGGYAGGALELQIRLMGWSNTGSDPDHRAEFSFNGTAVGAVEWDGQDVVTATVAVPAALVKNGANTLVVKGALMAGRSHSQFAVDWIEASFARTLAPRAGTQHFRADAASSLSAAAYAAPLALALDGSGGVTWMADGAGELPTKAWAVEEGDEQYALIEAEAVPMLTPAATAAGAWFLAETNRIDYLVVVSRELEPAVQELAAYRAGQGLRVGVAVFEEVCDLLADGTRTPQAVPALLARARATWAESPWLVLLAGGGHYDARGLASTKTDHVSPWLQATRDGYCAADGRLGDVDGDGLPEIAVGRLPAQTAEDLAAMVDKIKAFEAQFGSDWQNELTLVADATDTGNDFASANEHLAQLVQAPYAVAEQIDVDQLEVEPARERLAARFRAGTGFIHYTGHGGVEHLGAGSLLSTEDVAGLDNGERPAILMALSCLAGRFEEPAVESLGERLMCEAGGGAVAVVGPSGLSRNAPAVELGAAFYRAVLCNRVGTLGLAFLQARRSLPAAGFSAETLAVYNLLGDPALRLGGNVGGGGPDDTFAQWRWQQFAPEDLADAGVGGATAENFLRYALGEAGGVALTADRQGWLTGGTPGFVLSWRRRVNRADVDYRVYLSENLQQWELQEEAELETIGVEPDADGVMETVHTQLAPTNAAKLFMGIKAVRK